MFPKTKKALVGIAALGALALGGSAIAGAATSNGTSASTTQRTATAQSQPRPDFPAHGTAAHENAEKSVTGDAATKARAAAVKSVGSGAAGDVTTDMTGTGYETTVTTSDGSKVEVHLDSSFNVMQNHGGPGAPGAPGSH